MPHSVRQFAEVTEGEALPTRTIPVTRATLVHYAGASGDFNPIHHDEEFARAAGMPDGDRLESSRTANGAEAYADAVEGRIAAIEAPQQEALDHEPDEADEQLDLMGRVFSTLEIFRPEIFEAPLDQLVRATASRRERAEQERAQQIAQQQIAQQQAEQQRPHGATSGMHASGAGFGRALSQLSGRDRSARPAQRRVGRMSPAASGGRGAPP